MFFSKNSIVLVQTLRFFDPFFPPVNYCVWYEVGRGPEALSLDQKKKKKIGLQFFRVIFMIFFKLKILRGNRLL